tara:strand:- start:168 stop:458 length:291 start_codon:yes stop_codon:yes gene_type:complete
VIDYILKFGSKTVAQQFGIASGYAVDNEGIVETTLATHMYALHEIGEHNGADYWVLFRDLVGLPVPEGADQFIVWASNTDIPRPTEDPDVPTEFWA